MLKKFNLNKLWQFSLVAALSLAGLNTVSGQSSSAESIINPKVIPPSPDAQSFMRYGEIPVDFSTGVPNIDIPLYEIKSGKLSLPISLSYHSSGIRTTDIPSVVGLGWKLNAGGLVTRTVKGRPDDNSQGILCHGYLTQSGINNASLSSDNFYMLERISRGQQDSESDNYYYSVSDGLSGELVYDNLNNLVSLSYSDNIIKYNPVFGQEATNYFEIKKNDGTKYVFDKRERTLFDSEFYPSTWWLSKIISSDKTDSITFEYQKNTSTYPNFYLSESIIFGNTTNGSGTNGLQRTVQTEPTEQLLLSKINFRNGYIQFGYTMDRQDMRDYRLTSISIYNNISNKPLQVFQLSQTYFYSGYASNKFNYRLKLDALKLYDGNGNYLNNYTFSYNMDQILPPYISPTDLNQNACNAVDFWGYYNGKIQNTTMLPNLPASYNVITPANRAADSTYTKACILNKITYPTGGYSSFEYGPNRKSDGTIAGGLRISRITTKESDNSTPIIKRYQYGDNLISDNMDIASTDLARYQYVQNMMWVEGQCNLLTNDATIYMDNPIVPYMNFNGSSALYSSVDEYLDGGILGKLKTTYIYGAEPDIIWNINCPRYQDQWLVNRSWRRGHLDSIVYSKSVNGIYQPVKSISNGYGDYRTNTVIAGTKVVQITTNVGNDISCGNPPMIFLTTDTYTNGTLFNSLFYYFDVQMEVGIKKLISQTISEDGLTTIKNYIYGSPHHLFPTSTDYINSKGESLKSEFKYPHDSILNEPYTSMVTRNMISPVIEQTEKKNTTFLQSVKTNYYNPSGDIIAPLSAQQTIGAGTSTLVSYSYEDNGNISQYIERNGLVTTFLWGYNKAYPVAKIVSGSSITIDDALRNTINNHIFCGTDVKSCVDADVTFLNTQLTSYSQGNQITIYTYKPLIGMTSQTDPNGKTTYYEYDDFGRLKFTKDDQGKILRKFDYHYKN